MAHKRSPPRSADTIIAELRKLVEQYRSEPRTIPDVAAKSLALLRELEEEIKEQPRGSVRDSIVGAAAGEVVKMILQGIFGT